MVAESPDGESIPFPWFCFCARLTTRRIVFFYPGQPSAGLRNVSTDQKQQKQTTRNGGIAVIIFSAIHRKIPMPIKKQFGALAESKAAQHLIG